MVLTLRAYFLRDVSVSLARARRLLRRWASEKKILFQILFRPSPGGIYARLKFLCSCLCAVACARMHASIRAGY